MLANGFRRIALAQGLLPDAEPRPPAAAAAAAADPPAPVETPAPGAPEPCEQREDAA
jgi:hypothetical protein